MSFKQIYHLFRKFFACGNNEKFLKSTIKLICMQHMNIWRRWTKNAVLGSWQIWMHHGFYLAPFKFLKNPWRSARGHKNQRGHRDGTKRCTPSEGGVSYLIIHGKSRNKTFTLPQAKICILYFTEIINWKDAVINSKLTYYQSLWEK